MSVHFGTGNIDAYSVEARLYVEDHDAWLLEKKDILDALPKEAWPQNSRHGKDNWTLYDKNRATALQVLLGKKAFYVHVGPEGYSGIKTVSWGRHGGPDAAWQKAKELVGGFPL